MLVSSGHTINLPLIVIFFYHFDGKSLVRITLMRKKARLYSFLIYLCDSLANDAYT